MTTEEAFYTSIGQSISEAEQSQMFGKPCFKINGKAFVSFFQDAMVFKLTGNTREAALQLAGAVLFDPSGKNRPMKEWIQVPYAHQSEWSRLAQEAFQYVKSNKTRMQ
ncbi:hypothetical protein DBR32_04845 [Taibaiella sp. KBW10]|uniref:hypothetical protein n=1 Tax=Taibaiella sp. KBW10 TaxID=2153357 RepID=UPI000F593EFE|nr:hypothetical protein [Taibaiella sp. KBW10]RQO31296.1 hypothetical protein DBR32_04845 [Taibaiella sp. KBW10]